MASLFQTRAKVLNTVNLGMEFLNLHNVFDFIF